MRVRNKRPVTEAGKLLEFLDDIEGKPRTEENTNGYRIILPVGEEEDLAAKLANCQQYGRAYLGNGNEIFIDFDFAEEDRFLRAVAELGVNPDGGDMNPEGDQGAFDPQLATTGGEFGDTSGPATMESRSRRKRTTTSEGAFIRATDPQGDVPTVGDDDDDDDNHAELLKTAAKYLEHPDVQAIPFSLPASAVSKRLRKAVAKYNARREEGPTSGRLV